MHPRFTSLTDGSHVAVAGLDPAIQDNILKYHNLHPWMATPKDAHNVQGAGTKRQSRITRILWATQNGGLSGV